MTYTITTNPAFNSLEIAFDGKPAEEIREALKSLRFRWHNLKKVWYGYADEATVRAAIDGGETWKDLGGATTAPSGYKWQSNGKSRFSGEYKHRLVKEGSQEQAEPKAKAEAVNKYGVKVGDIFCATWGYEQTNNDFFQVIGLVGESSVRVREVYLPLIESTATGPMAEDRVLQVSREILPAADRSVFIKDQEKGDVKRLKSHAADGKSNPQFKLTSYCDAYYVGTDTIKVYESWYA